MSKTRKFIIVVNRVYARKPINISDGEWQPPFSAGEELTDQEIQNEINEGTLTPVFMLFDPSGEVFRWLDRG